MIFSGRPGVRPLNVLHLHYACITFVGFGVLGEPLVFHFAIASFLLQKFIVYIRQKVYVKASVYHTLNFYMQKTFVSFQRHRKLCIG